MMIIRSRDAAPLIDEPNEHLTDWRIIVLPDGNRHFCGIRANGTTTRVSSKIIMYDAEGKTGLAEHVDHGRTGGERLRREGGGRR